MTMPDEAPTPSRVRKPSTVVETFELTRRFGSVLAASDISFAVKSGEIFGSIGPEWRRQAHADQDAHDALASDLRARTLVAGFDVAQAACARPPRIGYVPQLLSADGELTGYENLLLSSRLYLIPVAERERRIAEALAMMGLSEVRDRLVRQYSGGMIRRLEIAQSTLHRPAVLFMDEPTVDLILAAAMRSGIMFEPCAATSEPQSSSPPTRWMKLEELCDRVGRFSCRPDRGARDARRAEGELGPDCDSGRRFYRT